MLCASTLLLLSSCYDEPTERGMITLLTKGTWQLTAWTSTPAYRLTLSNGTQLTVSDLFDIYAACRHDNEYIFYDVEPSNTVTIRGNYIYQEGAKACGEKTILESYPFYLQEEQGIVKIYFDLPAGSSYIKKYTIERLTQTSLIFSYKVQSGVTTYEWTEVFKQK